ncbi:hypothetical protein POX_h09553 [Penicillium oxalicum]|uniref:hypothetical protein n=1 Tax=Penicillium oxalicum TaxID=69781 RepID=UPI0020B8C171|nr:hypothetical protein POX_h09553 [Penicillium oxalicum]KAI2785794.1 hypothetical protein POX_h09553 [Penicillium oxalicum]
MIDTPLRIFSDNFIGSTVSHWGGGATDGAETQSDLQSYLPSRESNIKRRTTVKPPLLPSLKGDSLHLLTAPKRAGRPKGWDVASSSHHINHHQHIWFWAQYTATRSVVLVPAIRAS